MTLPSGRRAAGRADAASSYCPSCEIRMVIGKPNPNAPWYPRLKLTDEQVAWLITAGAEFDAFAAEHEDRPTAVEFVDWLAPSVRESNHSIPEADGKRDDAGVLVGHEPLPYAPVPVYRRSA